MSNVGGISSNTGTALMQVLENQMQAQADLAEKFIKITAEEKIQAAQLAGLGQIIDTYA